MNQYFVQMTPTLTGGRQAVDELAAMPVVSMVLEAPPHIYAVVEAESLADVWSVLQHVSNTHDPRVTKVRYTPIAMRRDQVTQMRGFPEASESAPIIDAVPGMPAATGARVFTNFSSQAGLASLATAGHMGAFGGGLNDHEDEPVQASKYSLNWV